MLFFSFLFLIRVIQTKKYMNKIIFADLDSTLIETRSGKTFPINILDFKPIWKVWKYLKANLGYGDYFFIVTNQGGLKFNRRNVYLFGSKLNYIRAALSEYLGSDITIAYDICYKGQPLENKMRKPASGMLENMVYTYGLMGIPKSSMLMIGDASGKPGDFSDSDLKAAENFGIKYLDVDDI